MSIKRKPFTHVVIDHFFDYLILNQLVEQFPKSDFLWWRYNNVLEKKLAKDQIDQMPKVHQAFIRDLNSKPFIEFLERTMGMENLIADDSLNGGGLHQIERGGKLDIHADYNYHPVTGLHRRLNVLIYLNPDWKEEWGGHLELWNRDMTECQARIAPFMNRMVIFKVDDWAYHGHPDPLMCPEGVTRKSVALYYYTQDRPEAEITPAHSTLYQRRPNDPQDPETESLRAKRAQRRLP